MNEKRFFKRSFSKVVSWLLTIAIILSMTPANFTLVAEASEGDTYITVHFQNEHEHNWVTPAIQWWNFNDVTASHNGTPVVEGDMKDIPGWNAKGAILEDDGDGFYSITLKGNIEGFQFLDMNDPSNNTKGKGYNSAAMSQYNDPVTPMDLYAIWGDDELEWYLDAAATQELKAPEGAVKSPVINEDGSVTFNYKISAAQLGENKLFLRGGEPISNWDPGTEMTDEDGDGIYSVTIPKVAPGEYQYKYFYGGNWVLDPLNSKESGGNSLLIIEAPLTKGTVDNKDGTTKFVFIKEIEAAEVKLVYGNKEEVASDINTLRTINMSRSGSGFYETENLFLGDEALDIIYYFTIGGEKELDDTNATVKINNIDYSNYTREAFTGRGTYVPGSFPGPAWDPGSNEMDYIGKGLYKFTFKNVPAANYEYKIAHGSWDENYGAKGEKGGANIKVTVTEVQDLIIYYSDFSHYSRTSIEYEFGANILLTGTNIDGATFEDSRLTGIYSVTVSLDVGTYNDVKIEYGNNTLTIDPFTLDSAKDVTFYFDPSTDIYYHNASDVEVNTKNIYFNTQDADYKSIFGAVATGENVTYSIQTGSDATSVKMVIKGKAQKAIAMTSTDLGNGNKKWTAKTSFADLGEYNYFFVISNGSAITIYGDDDGYYGEGKASDLLSVEPYDQIVYQAGFETPDWMKDAVIYQIFPDRFFDGDVSNNRAQTSARGAVDYEYVTDWYTIPENPEQITLNPDTYPENAWKGDGHWSNEIYGGDLKGITENINYLKALGVTVIYLNPVFASISSHRYDASDYGYIDPVLGTEGDFDELVSIAEENGMYVVLDGVFNHVSDDSKYFDRYYKYLEALKDSSEEERIIGAYPFWAYIFDRMNEEDITVEAAKEEAKTYFEEEYGINNWTYTQWFDFGGKDSYIYEEGKDIEAKDTIGLRAGKPVYSYDGWWGYDSMPVIIAANGSEYQTPGFAEEIIGPAESDPNSNITQYWLNKGMDGWRLDVANEVSDETWQKFRESVKALNDGNNVIIGEIWTDAVEYLMGDMYDSVMNYVFRGAVLNYTMGGKAEDYIKTLEKLRERYPEEAFYAMMNLVASHDTTRILSYLDGIEDDRNQKEVEKAFPSYEATSEHAKKSQYLAAFLQFTYPGAPTIYYGDEIGMVGADDPDDRRGMTWGKGNKEIVEWYAKLGMIRQKYEPLRTGAIHAFNSGSEKVVSFVRGTADERMIVLANNADTGTEITLNLGDLSILDVEFTDVVSGETYTSESGNLTVTVPALSGVILTKTSNVKVVTIDTDSLKPAYESEFMVADAKVTISRTSASMSVGNSITLTATGRGTIEWSTSNENVATVENGVVRAVGNGSASITATHSDGRTARCQISVGNSGGDTPATEIPVTPKEESVPPLDLPVEKKEDGTQVTVVKDKAEYDFASTKVEGDLEISANGAVIKNLKMDSDSELVIIGKNVVIEDSEINGTISIPGGTTKNITLNGTIAPKLVVEKVAGNSTKRVSLSISKNSSIAQLYINSGAKVRIEENKNANAQTAAKYTVNNMYISVAAKDMVTLYGDYNKITLSSKNSKVKLIEGKINQFIIKTTAANPNLVFGKGTSITALTTTPKKTKETLSYKSSNKKIAAVSQKGKVKAVKKGKATLTVQNSNGKAIKCKITVN